MQYEESHINCLSGTDGELSPSGDCGSGGSVISAGGSVLLGGVADKGSMVRAARCLLAAVTQVLLLADTVVVKQLLQAKDKVINIYLESIIFCVLWITGNIHYSLRGVGV